LVDAGLLPPHALVACAMRRAMVPAAECDRELIARFAAQSAGLDKSQVVGIRRHVKVLWSAVAPRSMQIRGPGPNSTFLWTSTELWNRLNVVNAQELRRLLASKGCTFETHKGGSGHLTVRRGDRKSQLPMHGSRKELGKGLVNKILKDLGLK
jgi:mRNA interferase HicA